MLYRLADLTTDFEGFQNLARLAADLEFFEDSSLEISLASAFRVDANMAAALGAVLAKASDLGNEVTIVEIPSIMQEALSRNGFLAGYGYPQPAHLGATALPFTRFHTTDALEFYDYLDLHLPNKGLPDASHDFTLALQQILGEMFANTETHSDSSLGVFFSGQFFPTEQRLLLTMADAGVTIPERVSLHFARHAVPRVALRWALIEGRTTKKDTPGGIGLKLLREFVRGNGGKVQIASGKAFWQFSAGGRILSEFEYVLPATVIAIEVNTANWQVPGRKPVTI